MNLALQTQTKAALSPSFATLGKGLLQRKCACGGSPGPTGECESCRKKKLQRRQGSLSAPSSINHSPSSGAGVPPIVHEVLRSAGQPLDFATRAFMEPRFGHDFSKVRVHTDRKAAESAAAVNALAYTVGRDVVFATGQYAPASTAGKKVVAHELTHVVQQRKGIIAPRHSAGAAIIRDDAYERDADAQSVLVGEGKPAGSGLHQSRDAGTAPAHTIQLLEKPTTSSSQRGGGANVAQEVQGNSDSAATDDEGETCIRFYFPGVTGGKATWEGISQETLDRHVRLKSEDDLPSLFKATANSTDTCDAVYFGPAYGRFVLKIPDHCTVTFENGFKRSACCNAFGSLVAELKGKAVAPRPGTSDEFGIPNDWEPAKPPGAKPVKPPEKPKGTPIPIIG